MKSPFLQKTQQTLISVFLIFNSALMFGQGHNLLIKKEKVKEKKEKTFLQKSILPSSLIALGFVLSESDFENNLQRDLRNQVGNDYYNNIDDYTRYVPIVQMYAADILGIKAKNHWFDQTKNLFISSLVTAGVTGILKESIGKQRPGNSDNFNSFPSGHTSVAFSNASVLYEEFKDTSPVLAYSGYLFAVTTGTFRMVNNAHYLSDVIAGAGIGILITKLVYHLDPIIKWNPFKKKEGVTFVPQFNGEKVGMYFSLRF
ncbi:phosphatase PAP2 family protein [Aquimarina latercula]|uniref:phosphatase PAP2 family protein n=1 Tax=Aquimarina latercula TaxID=987 RepID=UPI000685238C|nr:phosphatase PAP2 family protein [Aquimarina latercula]